MKTEEGTSLLSRWLPNDPVERRRTTVPVVVWSVCALLALSLLVQRTQRYHYVGIAQSRDFEISANLDGAVDAVLVELNDRVKAGDVIARLDDSTLRAQIETSRATIRKLTSDLDAARVDLASTRGDRLSSWVADLRRFQIDEERRQLEAMSLRVQVESDEVELQRLQSETKRHEALLAAGVASQLEVDNLRSEQKALLRKIEESRTYLAQIEKEYDATRKRREAFERQTAPVEAQDPILMPLREAIAVEQQRLKEIETQRAALTLRSPVAGQVASILCRTGQSVVPGEPIAVVTEESVREIVAFVGEDDGIEVKEQTPVLITSRRARGAAAESVVLKVGDGIQALPARLWRDPRTADYGRTIVIASTPAMLLQPGELVDIKFLD